MRDTGDSEKGDAMTASTMEHIPLKLAYLCQDCDCVGNCATQCPACASSSLLNLSAVLNRDRLEIGASPAETFAFRRALAA
jgi:hypothetical protein